ncbi:hypothetical protein [Serratia liquefaciens]|uniref:hypothetical protein n=1 Tax=Serratia liquefaciens TaxID=614 RepID=UPI0023603264|nr:hypothetical protein [Serratia liquefaciens]
MSTTGVSVRVPEADWSATRAWFRPPLDETLGGWGYINLFGTVEKLEQNLSRNMPGGIVTGTPVRNATSALFRRHQNYISTQVAQAYAMTFFAIAKTARTLANQKVGNEFIISNNLSNGPDGGTNGTSLYFADHGDDGKMNVTFAVTQTESPPGTPAPGRTTQLSISIPITDKPIVIIGSYSAAENVIRIVVNGQAIQATLPVNSATSIQRGAPPRVGSIGQNTGTPPPYDVEVFAAALLTRKIASAEETTLTEWGYHFLDVKGVAH